MLEYKHLLGRTFVYGGTDCLGLLRDFYKENFSINFPNYARPVEFWKHGMDLYKTLVWKNGFRPLDCHPSEYLPGDLLLIAINSNLANHACVLLEDSYILHHVYGNLSTAEFYSGAWRNRTLGVYRHPAVKYVSSESTLDLMDLLPKAKQDALRTSRQTVR